MRSEPKTHIYKLCSSKRPYSRKKFAEERIGNIRRGGKRHGKSLVTYKCPFGDHYHIGHPREER